MDVLGEEIREATETGVVRCQGLFWEQLLFRMKIDFGKFGGSHVKESKKHGFIIINVAYIALCGATKLNVRIQNMCFQFWA